MTHNKLFQDGTPTRFGLWGLWRGHGKCKKVELTFTRMDANNYDKLFMLRMDMWDYNVLIVWLYIVCFN